MQASEVPLARRGRRCRPQIEPLEKRELLDASAAGLAYGHIPLSFEANQGQTDPAVQFLSRGSGYTLFLTSQEAVLSLNKTVAPGTGSAAAQGRPVEDVLRLQLVGANAAPRVTGEEKLPGTTNYFLGNDPAQWRMNVPTFGKVAYQDAYPGVDLVYYGNQRQLEYDFVVQPGADPGIIQLSFQGAQDLALDVHGNLVLHTDGGDVIEQAPVIYQEQAGYRQAVGGRYVLKGQNQVGFQVDAYDVRQPLIIDPVLSYSTYLGGTGDDGGARVAVDTSGNAYVTGSTDSVNFPTTPGAFQTAGHNFVAKLNATGTALVYSTYLGGTGSDSSAGIAVDGSGNVYVTGVTSSSDFPTTPGAVQTAYGGGSNEAFVTELNATGSALVYSTYLGGTNRDYGTGIAVDASGNAYVSGTTESSNFPTTPGAFQSNKNGNSNAFVAKLDATGSALLYSTYLGGNGSDSSSGIAVDLSGDAYVTGESNSPNFPTTPGAFQTTNRGSINAFVAKLNASGTALLYGTYLGGSGFDGGNGIAVDASGNAYVTGIANSLDFPTTPGAFQTTKAGNTDAFVAKLNATGSGLLYATYLGGDGFDYGLGIAVNSSGNAYVTGYTDSVNFPTTPGAFQSTKGGGTDAFVVKLNASGTALLYAIYLGGSGFDQGIGIAVDGSGNAYVTGETASPNFPTTPGCLQPTYGGGNYDTFIAKILSQASSMELSSSPNPSVYGQLVTFTATVTSGGTPVSTGTVTFQDGGIVLASAVPLVTVP
jgi:hypothetical protein